jgi:glycosyltransferase involved in cell wall biosynthesis
MQTNITLSIITGTINRLDGLKEMVNSVRATVPETMRYEFVIADNGSTDGTEAWIKEQPDCRLIQLGKPVGGVKALTEAGHAAKGKYSLISTDDSAFPPYAIVRAISYLETHTDVGAVCFEDDIEQLKDFDLQTMYNKDGETFRALYPQVALIRTWLGNACDWWGGRTLMKKAWTYAGDNHLGYQIWMRGYRVVKVPGVTNIAYYIKDEVSRYQRSVNKQDRKTRESNYGHPRQPFEHCVYPGEPQVENPDTEELRILFLNDYIRRVPHWRTAKPAFKNAVAECGIVWEHLIKDGDDVPFKVMQAAGALQPHLILSNIHNNEIFNPEQVRRIRQAAPDAIWLNWIGDVWPKYHVNPDWAKVWHELDGLLVVNADMIPVCADHGIKAYYWQSGPEENDGKLDVAQHDVIFQGNGHRRPNKCGHRAVLYDTLIELRNEGIDVGIYGENGDDDRVTGNTFWHFDQTQALNKHAKLVVSDNEFCASGYTSKRFFDIMYMGGGMILHQQTPNFDELMGIKDGVHYVSWKDYPDLQKKIRYWLKPENQKRRKAIARNAKRVCMKKHTYPARMKELLIEVIPQAAKEAKR